MERKLVHANVPILNWSVANAVAVTDPAGEFAAEPRRAARAGSAGDDAADPFIADAADPFAEPADE